MDMEFEIAKGIILEECKDSMLFDSGTQIATYGTPDNYVSLEVCGEVRVTYQDQIYRYATKMPEELLEKFKGEWWLDDDIYVSENNWFDYVHILNDVAQQDDMVCEDDISTMSEFELEEHMAEAWNWFNHKDEE